MYKYEIVKVNLKVGATNVPTEDYHKIIHDYAKEGWRLLQIFAPPVYSGGTASYFELIFEKAINS